MITTNQNSLFELTIDQEAVQYLTETARWGRFMAILGFVGCGLMLILSFVIGATMNAEIVNAPGYPAVHNAQKMAQTGDAIFIVLAIVGSAIAFFPCLTMFNFSRKLKTALRTNDQVTMNRALKSQKILYRFVGIVSIIGIALLGISIFFNMMNFFL